MEVKEFAYCLSSLEFTAPQGVVECKVAYSGEPVVASDRIQFLLEFSNGSRLELWLSNSAVHLESANYLTEVSRCIEEWLHAGSKTGRIECFGRAIGGDEAAS